MSDRNHAENDVILLAHGDGGRLTHQLITELFFRHLGNETLVQLTDAASLPVEKGRIGLTTDSFTINPPFFPGGDIGKLAVCGTVNDLAVSGARPKYLAVGFLIEEGFLVADLERIAASMAATCARSGVQVVAGDTKVVARGQLDRIFINTTGVGVIPDGVDLGYHRLQPGDRIIVNGNIGDHGMAILAAREDFGFEHHLVSDCAPLDGLAWGLIDGLGEGLRLMRDLTRGGLATSAKEIAVPARRDLWLKEEDIPVDPHVRGAAEILGLDPLYLANEGKLMAVVAADKVEKALQLMRGHEFGRDAAVIGEVREGDGQVYLRTSLGGTKHLDLLAGAPLPRIC